MSAAAGERGLGQDFCICCFGFCDFEAGQRSFFVFDLFFEFFCDGFGLFGLGLFAAGLDDGLCLFCSFSVVLGFSLCCVSLLNCGLFFVDLFDLCFGG